MKLEHLLETDGRPYYSLAVFDKEAGQWYVEFGDYDRKAVKYEAETMFGERKKIIKTADNQEAINAALADLNSR